MTIVQTIVDMIEIMVGAEMKGGKIEIINGGPYYNWKGGETDRYVTPYERITPNYSEGVS